MNTVLFVNATISFSENLFLVLNISSIFSPDMLCLGKILLTSEQSKRICFPVERKSGSERILCSSELCSY